MGYSGKYIYIYIIMRKQHITSMWMTFHVWMKHMMMELNNYPTSYDDDDDNDGGGGDGVNTLGFNQQSRDKCNGY